MGESYRNPPALEPSLSSRLDAIDWKILKEMQDDGRITNVELARRVGISAPPCLRRVRALEEAGFIKGYRALLDEILPDPRFCYSMELERGDMQIVNNYVVIHSRTNFEDFDEPERKRHLLRLWLDVPQSTQLPEAWGARFPDVRAGAVRGGFRGSCITPEFLAFEARQARAMGMALGQTETVEA